MDTNEIRIRPATEADAEEILNIYAPYVRTQQLPLNMTCLTLEEFTGLDSPYTGEISVSGGGKRWGDHRLCICRSFLWPGCI